jgi:hypothetical protein
MASAEEMEGTFYIRDGFYRGLAEKDGVTVLFYAVLMECFWTQDAVFDEEVGAYRVRSLKYKNP